MNLKCLLPPVTAAAIRLSSQALRFDQLPIF